MFFDKQLELVDPPWAVNDDKVVALTMPFCNAFLIRHRTSTASKKKFIRFTVYGAANGADDSSDESRFLLKNHCLSVKSNHYQAVSLINDDISMVSNVTKFLI